MATQKKLYLRMLKLKPGEVFVLIKNTAGIYKISNYGRVYSLKRNDVIPTYNNTFVAKTLTTHGDVKPTYYSVPRLVLNYFRPDILHDKYVKYLDGKSTNNHIDNLAWTPKRP